MILAQELFHAALPSTRDKSAGVRVIPWPGKENSEKQTIVYYPSAPHACKEDMTAHMKNYYQ